MTATATTNARTKAEREAMLMEVQKAIGKEVKERVPKRHREDVEQEVQLAVWRATELFDPTRGTKWSTYGIGAVKNAVSNWLTYHNCEDKGPVREQDHEFLDRQVAPESSDPEGDDGTDETQLDGETMGQLASAVRHGLAEGVLAKLAPGHRRLVELVAFEGLTAEQIATQDGHPPRVVRTNLKAALKKLCELGHTQHAVTDAEVKAVTAPQKPKTQDERERQSLRQGHANREDTQLRNALAQELAHDGAALALDAFGEPVKAVTLELAAKRVSVSQAGTRLKLVGARTRELFQRVLSAVRAHVNGAVASELAQAATAPTFRNDLNDLDADTHAAVLAVMDRTLSVDDVAELLGTGRAKVVQKLRNVAAMGREPENGPEVDPGAIAA